MFGAGIAYLNSTDCYTNMLTKVNCSGICQRCPFCNDSYSTYHFEGVDDLSTVMGGHCCKGKTKGYVVGNIIGDAIEVGLVVANVADAAKNLHKAEGLAANVYRGGKLVKEVAGAKELL